MTAILPVRVMVQDAWDEVHLELPPLRRCRTSSARPSRPPASPAIRPATSSSSVVRSCRTRPGRLPTRAWYPTARSSSSLNGGGRCGEGGFVPRLTPARLPALTERSPVPVPIFTHPDCLRHDPGPDHPETPARLRVLLDRARAEPA